MRLLSKVALGGSVASAATVGVLVAAGVFATSATLVIADPVAPPAKADELTKFDSCGDLLDWYVERGVRDVGAYGWKGEYGWGYNGVLDGRMAFSEVAGTISRTVGLATVSKNLARSSSETGTNTQEEAVDEPDVAKTNGSLVARIVGRRLVLVDVTQDEPKVTHRLLLPKAGYGSELLLIGDRVIITQQAYQLSRRAMRGELIASYPGYSRGNGTRILEVDISDPAAPKVVRTDLYSGDLVSLRQYGETVRLITSTRQPTLKWTYPKKGTTRREAAQQNRALVRQTTIEDWVPSVKRSGVKKPLLDCDQVLHPKKWSGTGTVAVTTYDVGDADAATTAAVTASGQVVYSSADRLYVASTNYGEQVDPMSGVVRRSRSTTFTPAQTDVHAFALDGVKTAYVASGHIAGSVRDRWSLDEYDGKLRVAWTTTNKRGATKNGISVLTEKDGRLEQTGFVDGLGPKEDIQSVRWLDDLAIVVTFRQVDPLYTIDLSDQDHPRTLGALKIPGYSGYLHPIGGNLLLGLGVDADKNGNTRGAQAAVFDISDLTDPKRISKVTFGRDTWMNALEDPRAFTWLAENRTAATPLADWRHNKHRLVGFDVSATGQLTSRTLIALNEDYSARTLDLGEGRLAVLDSHRVRVVKVG